MWKSTSASGAYRHRHAIDATPARWRADAGMHPTHWLISTQHITLHSSDALDELLRVARVDERLEGRRRLEEDQVPGLGLEEDGPEARAREEPIL